MELVFPEASEWILYGDPLNNLQTFLIVQQDGSDVPEIGVEQSGAAPDESLRLQEGSPRSTALRALMRKGF